MDVSQAETEGIAARRLQRLSSEEGGFRWVLLDGDDVNVLKQFHCGQTIFDVSQGGHRLEAFIAKHGLTVDQWPPPILTGWSPLPIYLATKK